MADKYCAQSNTLVSVSIEFTLSMPTSLTCGECCPVKRCRVKEREQDAGHGPRQAIAENLDPVPLPTLLVVLFELALAL